MMFSFISSGDNMLKENVPSLRIFLLCIMPLLLSSVLMFSNDVSYKYVCCHVPWITLQISVCSKIKKGTSEEMKTFLWICMDDTVKGNPVLL
jgi:hypothetical protein